VVGVGSYNELQRSHRGWIEEYLANWEKSRQDEWSKSIAVGSRSFVEMVKQFLGIRAKGRDVVEGGQGYQLREAAADYKPLLEDENEDIGLENAYGWDLNGG
jgi:putative transposase